MWLDYPRQETNVDELQQRGKALENLFFQNKDAELIEKMKAELAAEEGKQTLASATGINDESTLSALVDLGIAPESLASVGLIPLIAVAWSDGVIEDKEREAIMSAAEGAGVAKDSPGYALLNGWLDQQPGPDLLDCWKSYVSGLKSTVDEAAFGQIKTSVLGRAKAIAEAAGGFLGLGNKISDSESKVLEELEAAF